MGDSISSLQMLDMQTIGKSSTSSPIPCICIQSDFGNTRLTFARNLNDLELSHYDRQVNVMQRSVFLAIKYGSQAMMVTSAEKPTPGGAIVVTSSCAAFLGAYADLGYSKCLLKRFPWLKIVDSTESIVYTATVKLATNGLVMGGSVQLSTSNIRINGVAPGFTQTSILTSSKEAEKGSEYKVAEDEKQIKKNHEWFFERAGLLSQSQYYYNRTAEPTEIANVAVFLATDLASAINGQVILADSGKTAAATGEGCTGVIPVVKPLDLS